MSLNSHLFIPQFYHGGLKSICIQTGPTPSDARQVPARPYPLPAWFQLWWRSQICLQYPAFHSLVWCVIGLGHRIFQNCVNLFRKTFRKTIQFFTKRLISILKVKKGICIYLSTCHSFYWWNLAVFQPQHRWTCCKNRKKL